MEDKSKSMPRAKERQQRQPDRSKCRDQKSRELDGRLPGDRGMCQKQSTTQGSE